MGVWWEHHRKSKEGPHRLSPIEIVVQVLARSRSDDILGLAAELAFRFFLALFPFFIFLGAIGSFLAGIFGVHNPAVEAARLLGSNLPPDAREAVRSVVSGALGKANENMLSVTIVGAIWAATGGTNALIKGLNRAYDVVETRPFWYRYLMALGLTLISAPIMLLALIVLVVVQAYGSGIVNALGVGEEAHTAVEILRWPVVVALVAVAAGLLYRLTPNTRLPWKWFSPGAVLFSIGWLLATYVFGIYVSHFSSFDTTYGVLGGVAVLMIWFYITALALLLGAEVNAVVDRAEARVRATGQRSKNGEEVKQEQMA